MVNSKHKFLTCLFSVSILSFYLLCSRALYSRVTLESRHSSVQNHCKTHFHKKTKNPFSGGARSPFLLKQFHNQMKIERGHQFYKTKSGCIGNLSSLSANPLVFNLASQVFILFQILDFPKVLLIFSNPIATFLKLTVFLSHIDSYKYRKMTQPSSYLKDTILNTNQHKPAIKIFISIHIFNINSKLIIKSGFL